MEMIDRTASNSNSTISDDDLQQSFKTMAEAYGSNYGAHSTKAFAPISQNFLTKHADLLEVD